jgi:hypothetical protein
MFIDIGKEYRAKVNAFNAGSFYGAQQANIQKDEQERTETRSKGGLNETAKETSYWETDNPHRSVLGDQAFMNNYGMWNTKYEEKEVNKLQHIQQKQYGYHRNYWVEHLEEIERNRVANVVPSMVGNGNMVLIVDKNA